MTVLDFEKPITEIQEKIDELKKISLESGMDLNKEKHLNSRLRITKKICIQI